MQILTPSGIPATVTKSDVGLGDVDNTSDSTKNSATATLTNKTISGASNTISSISKGCISGMTGTALSSPADASTYYMGGISVAPDSTEASFKMYPPRTCTIKIVSFWVVKTTAASNENVSIYLRLNATTDYTLSTTMQWTTANSYDNIIATGLSIPITAGDFVAFKVVTPTWATNPADCYFGWVIEYE